MTEGKIVEWLKNPGDKVERGESVLVVESDKADMDVESFQDGYLAAVLMPAGSTAPVGETIGIIVESENEIESVQAQNNNISTAKDKPKKIEVNDEVEIQITKKVESVSTPIEKEKTQEKKIEVNASTSNSSSRVVASPKAKKIASQMGIDLSKVNGSGPHGRIQVDDVMKAKGQPVSVPWIGEGSTSASIINANSSVRAQSENVGNSFGNPGETVQFNTLQKAVNKNMESSLSVPCFRVGYSINTDKLDSFYKTVKQLSLIHI